MADQLGSRIMNDSTVKKVSERTAPKGSMGQTYLVSGKRVSMRLWKNESPQASEPDRRNYETVGYVLAGRAELILEGQTIKLAVGDSWLVPAQSEHSYRILEPFTAIEATAPPAEVHGRDETKQ
jgi:quercetin dioxygenase-like cupin family protein